MRYISIVRIYIALIKKFGIRKVLFAAQEAKRQAQEAKRKEIIDKGFNDILDVLGRYHR